MNDLQKKLVDKYAKDKNESSIINGLFWSVENDNEKLFNYILQQPVSLFERSVNFEEKSILEKLVKKDNSWALKFLNTSINFEELFKLYPEALLQKGIWEYGNEETIKKILNLIPENYLQLDNSIENILDSQIHLRVHENLTLCMLYHTRHECSNVIFEHLKNRHIDLKIPLLEKIIAQELNYNIYLTSVKQKNLPQSLSLLFLLFFNKPDSAKTLVHELCKKEQEDYVIEQLTNVISFYQPVNNLLANQLKYNAQTHKEKRLLDFAIKLEDKTAGIVKL